MSTIRVDNFGPSAGGTTYSARGIAKAWVNFNGTGTIAARDSENVSSLTDLSTGTYAVNFANAFGAADYSFTASSRNSGIAASVTSSACNSASVGLVNTLNSSLASIDVNTVLATSHGDLA